MCKDSDWGRRGKGREGQEGTMGLDRSTYLRWLRIEARVVLSCSLSHRCTGIAPILTTAQVPGDRADRKVQGPLRPPSNWPAVVRSPEDQEILVGPPPIHQPPRLDSHFVSAAKPSRQTAGEMTSSSRPSPPQLTGFFPHVSAKKPSYRADNVGARWRERRCSLLETRNTLNRFVHPARLDKI